MSLGLSLEQTQQLELTPEVREGIEIMAMSVLDLRAMIYDRAISNPFLKIDESFNVRTKPTDTERTSAYQEYEKELIEERAWEHGQDAEVWDHLSAHSDFIKTGADASDPEEVIQHVADERTSLESVIMEQLALDLRNAKDISIAEYLLSGIDENGYLHMDTDIVANILDVSPNRVEIILKKMRTDCNPAGIGARTLQERLLSQLEAIDDIDDITKRIIEDHLSKLAQGNLKQIASSLSISLQDVKHSLEKIRRLDPHPAAAFDRTRPMIVPEVVVFNSNGTWSIKARRGLLPRILLDDEYSGMIKNGYAAFDKKATELVKKLLREAEGFIRAIDLRKASILAISSSVVERQSSFFENGISGLQALTMSEISSSTGLSEATVSRVANSTFLDTPQGIISLRYFFNSGVGESLASNASSSLAVKQIIRELIDSEDKRHPLSDSKIVELLQERGVNASRRTVNKYRSALGILSTSKRKDYN